VAVDNRKVERVQETHDVTGFNLEFSRWAARAGAAMRAVKRKVLSETIVIVGEML
jgi:hypothetical protein